MREDFLMDAVSHLDTEVIENYHKYKNRLTVRKKRKKTIMKRTAMAACLIIFFAVSYPIIEKFIPRKMGGEIGEYEICSSEVKFIGEPIKENELKNYLMEQESYILSYISKKINVDVNSLRICDKGIYHVNATQKSNYVNYDTITYFVMDKDCSVIASVDLFRDGNTLNFQVNTLGLAITELNRILSERPNTDFAMIYIGASIEALIAPDNTIYFLNGKKEVQENIDYYSLFNKEINLINFDLLNIESGSARNRKELKEIISDNFGYMMDSVLKRAELYNLSEQKIEEFSVLKPVSFNKIDATNNNSESVFHFPISDKNGEICLIFDVIFTNGGYSTTIGVDFALLLNCVYKEDTSVTLIQDGYSFYVLTEEEIYRQQGSKIEKILDSEYEEISSLINGFDEMTKTLLSVDNELSAIAKKAYDLCFEAKTEVRSTDATGAMSLSNYPIVDQMINNQQYNLCWAATVASIVRFEKPLQYGNLTAKDVADYMGIGYNDKGDETESIEALEHYLGSPYVPTLKRNILTNEEIKIAIDNIDPIYMQCRTSIGFLRYDYHAVAIIGYDFTNGYSRIEIMDPMYVSYKFCTMDSNGDWKIVCSGYTYTWTKTIRLLYSA